ncbi:MAG: radical SAM family heme chaperone HemW [Christensenellales bacterium]
MKAGLYIHIPFCESKCYYCDFCSGNFSEEIRGKYVRELISEIKATGKNSEKVLKTIYIGGGTPSVLTARQLSSVIEAVYSSFKCDVEEFTIETNPNLFADFADYKKMGVNRLSVGVQTLDDVLLKKIGRRHDSAQAVFCLENAGKYFDNVSADIMLGLDENQDVKKDLQAIIPLVKHLSTYMLKVENGTKLKKMIADKTVSVATENATISQYETVQEKCNEAGFNRYEISNFALSGYESRHNSSYWDMTDYYGVGVSAHSYVDGERYYNGNGVIDYIKGKHSGNGYKIIERKFSVEDEKEEYIMLSLRTVRGLDLLDYKKRFNEDFSVAYATKLSKLNDYLSFSDDRISIKEEYFLVQNSVISELI